MNKPMPNRLSMVPMALIAAIDADYGYAISDKDGLPWDNKHDMKHFMKLTKGKPCVMGRVTYEEMVKMVRARKGLKDDEVLDELLPERQCFVVSTQEDLALEGGAILVKNLRGAVQMLPHNNREQVMVLGGRRLWIEASAWADTVYISAIKKRHGCDMIFPKEILRHRYVAQRKECPEDSTLLFLTYAKRR